jgi:hypothetical protein
VKKIASLMLLSLLTFLPLAQSHGAVFDTDNREFFVVANGLRVRSTPEDTGKTMGLLALNDKVTVVSDAPINNKYVEIKILKSSEKFLPAEKYYVVMEFLAEQEENYKEFKGKYFVVVNVATETLRVYERQCLDNSCPNKMIMETEVVVGEDKDHPIAEKGKGRSILGSYRVTGWGKFYQDTEGHYPAWYKDGYPAVPPIGNNDWRDWFKDKYMPPNAEGKRHGVMRGAFGWYTAFVGPNPFGQWTHGTLGWGEDKDKYIQKTKKFMINIVSDPRSSGCTRNNNEAIAYLRQLTDTGTPIIKIYAREALMDPTLANYHNEPVQWNYVMTKNAGQKADRAEVVKALGLKDEDVTAYWNAFRAGGAGVIDPKSKLNQILEVGTYTIDGEPTVIPFAERKKVLGKWRATGRFGNVYGLKKEEMSPGVFYIDSGFLDGYHHPKVVLESSGFEDEETPPWMDAKILTRTY